MAVPFGILVAIYTSEFAGPRSNFAIRYVLDIMNGVTDAGAGRVPSRASARNLSVQPCTASASTGPRFGFAGRIARSDALVSLDMWPTG